MRWGTSGQQDETTAVGVAYSLGVLVVLVPLLPFLVIVWLMGKVMDRYRRDTARG